MSLCNFIGVGFLNLSNIVFAIVLRNKIPKHRAFGFKIEGQAINTIYSLPWKCIRVKLIQRGPFLALSRICLFERKTQYKFVSQLFWKFWTRLYPKYKSSFLWAYHLKSVQFKCSLKSRNLSYLKGHEHRELSFILFSFQISLFLLATTNYNFVKTEVNLNNSR